MRISDWSSDVCSSDLGAIRNNHGYAQILTQLLGDRPGKGIHGSAGRKGNDECYRLIRPFFCLGCRRQDRKSVVQGKSVSVRVDLGGRRSIKKKIENQPMSK